MCRLMTFNLRVQHRKLSSIECSLYKFIIDCASFNLTLFLLRLASESMPVLKVFAPLEEDSQTSRSCYKCHFWLLWSLEWAQPLRNSHGSDETKEKTETWTIVFEYSSEVVVEKIPRNVPSGVLLRYQTSSYALAVALHNECSLDFWSCVHRQFCQH